MAPENPEKNPENKSNLSPESKPQPQLDKTLASGLTNYIIHGDTIQNLGQVGGAGCDNMDNFNPIFSDNRKMGHNRSASDPKMSSKNSNGLGAISDAPAMAGSSDGPRTNFNSSQLYTNTESENSKIENIVNNMKIYIKGEHKINIAPKSDPTVDDSSDNPIKTLRSNSLSRQKCHLSEKLSTALDDDVTVEKGRSQSFVLKHDLRLKLSDKKFKDSDLNCQTQSQVKTNIDVPDQSDNNYHKNSVIMSKLEDNKYNTVKVRNRQAQPQPKAKLGNKFTNTSKPEISELELMFLRIKD